MRIFNFYPIGRAKKAFATWEFDCNAFSAAFTSFYNQHFYDDMEMTKYYYIGLRMDRKDSEFLGLYELGGSIFVNAEYLEKLPAKKFDKELFVILLHEMMHWIQYTFYKWDDAKITEGMHTDNCEAELMCMKFEKQARHVLKLYNTLKCIQKHEYR